MTSDLAALDRAAELAAESLGATSPNPPVGAVVVAPDGTVVGEGRHRVAGGPHAEVVALESAGAAARGATAVVTLEPCAAHGRTPPCTEALLAARVARVVYAVADPTTSGGGAALLRDAGIDVAGPTSHAAAERVTEPWLTAQRTGRPHVHWKVGASLDGRVAATDGSSRWITSPESRTDAHRLRAQVDAIVVGTGTVLADDPSLTIRHGVAAHRSPLRVIAGARPIPADARIFDDAAETVQFADPDPAALLKQLGERGIVSVLLEGGPTLAGAFATAGLIDRVTVYTAPILLGGGPSMLTASIPTLTDGIRLQIDDVTQIGPDLRISARVVAA